MLKQRLKKKQGNKTMDDLLTEMKNIKVLSSGCNKEMIEKLFGVGMIPLAEQALSSFKDKKWGKKASSTISSLKGKITKWFNKHEQEFKKEIEIIKVESQDQLLKSLQISIPTEWRLYTVPELEVKDTDNQMTKRSKKQSVAVSKKKANAPPTSKHFNWNKTNIILKETLYQVNDADGEDKNPGSALSIQPKLITVQFTTDEKEKNDGFVISCYQDFEKDLRELFEQQNFIYPIFVPSKNRPTHVERILLSGELMNYPFLIYVVVEETELEQYIQEFSRNEYYNQNRESVVFVSIPGQDRGVGFARSCIKMVQEALWERVSQFNYYWTIDDDIVCMNQFDTRTNKTGIMRKTFIGLVLHSCQIALKESLKQSENRYIKDDDGVEINPDIMVVFQNHSKVSETKRISIMVHRLEELFQLIDDANFEKFESDFSSKLKIENSDLCFKELLAISREIQQTSISEARMAITNSSCKTNYNFKGTDMHYRISSQQHACVLNYAPGLIGYNFLSWDHMLVDQSVVNAQKLLFKTEKKSVREGRRRRGELQYRDYFDGEDKLFSNLLELDNRQGYLMYFFEVKYGIQKKGGCFHFRAPGVKY